MSVKSLSVLAWLWRVEVVNKAFQVEFNSPSCYGALLWFPTPLGILARLCNPGQAISSSWICRRLGYRRAYPLLHRCIHAGGRPEDVVLSKKRMRILSSDQGQPQLQCRLRGTFSIIRRGWLRRSTSTRRVRGIAIDMPSISRMATISCLEIEALQLRGITSL